MKRLHYYIVGTIVIFALTVFATAFGAMNGAKELENAVKLAANESFVALNARYEKVTEFNELVGEVDETANELISDINARILSFNNNMHFPKTFNPALEDAFFIDENFNELVSYLKANHESTLNAVPESFTLEFDNVTVALIPHLTNYNAATSDFNKYITLFPNSLYLGKYAAHNLFDLTLYPLNLLGE